MDTDQDVIISVIIPSCKPQNYILECLQSLDDQSLDKNIYEVIIVINGEREPYYSFINNILTRCRFTYKIFYTDIAGVSNARNVGIEQSKGKYIAFIDDDDIVSENYLQGLYDIAKNNKMPLSYIKAFAENISDNINYYYTDIYQKIIHTKLTILNARSYFSSACFKLISREMIGTHRFNKRFQNGEDALFMFAISKRNMELQLTDKNVIYYRRIRNNSLNFRKTNLLCKIRTQFGLVLATMAIYLKTPMRYSFLFLISRILAYLRAIIIKNK